MSGVRKVVYLRSNVPCLKFPERKPINCYDRELERFCLQADKTMNYYVGKDEWEAHRKLYKMSEEYFEELEYRNKRKRFK